ncbi:MAG: hypothetical protein KGL90_15395 [Burkholderiales bacterium]|nr:hypothetical protein [Burkholderiales bacterium]
MTSATAPTIDASGITAPDYATILTWLQAQYHSIFGSDVYLGNDSQDGQFLGIVAAAINDSNMAVIAAWNSAGPATAQGEALSSRVKINGISRAVATNSQVAVTLVGQAGATINNGVVQDANGNKWSLPSVVVIPPGGSITVTATCQTIGSISASAGTVNKIATPTLGWQTVTNASAASAGNPVETDAQLRKRQAQSVALPSVTVLGGILGAVQAVSGVVAATVYENDTDAADANSQPAHSIAAVVKGGNSADIARAIMLKKTPGTYTHGTTVVSVTDDIGIPHTIRYFQPADAAMAVEVRLKALSGYTTAVAALIQQAVTDYINGLGIGATVMLARLYLPAQLNGGSQSSTFEVLTVKAALKPGSPAASDVTVAFNALASCAVADVSIVVVP